MPVTLPELTAEITNDPLGYGYAPLVAAGNDQGIASLLNRVRTGADGKPAITIRRPDCSPAEILEAIDVRDLTVPAAVASAPLAQSWLESITQFPTIRLLTDAGAKTLVRRNIDRLVTDVNGSQGRLDAVAVRNGSRAEQLFGVGSAVTGNQVAAALGRP